MLYKLVQQMEKGKEMGMNKRELQEQIDNLREQIKIYQDHLSFEQSKSSGLKANLRDKKRIIEENLKDTVEQQKLLDRYSDRVDFLEDEFKFLSDRLTQYQKELAEEYRQADAIDQQKIESKMQAIETVKALMEM